MSMFEISKDGCIFFLGHFNKNLIANFVTDFESSVDSVLLWSTLLCHLNC